MIMSLVFHELHTVTLLLDSKLKSVIRDWSEAIAIDYNPTWVYNFSYTKGKTDDHTLVPKISVDSCLHPFHIPTPIYERRAEKCTGASKTCPDHTSSHPRA
jgi:hypothetical protein